MRAALLLVSAAVTQADEFSDIFYPAADVGKPKCGLECNPENLRQALKKGNHASWDCAFSECGDKDCDGYSLQELCEASVWHRDEPWYYIADNAEAVLCCHQLGSAVDNEKFDIDRRNNDRNPRIQQVPRKFGWNQGPVAQAKASQDSRKFVNNGRSLSPISYDMPGLGKVSRRSASDMKALGAFVKENPLSYGLPKPWRKPAPDTAEPQARRLDEYSRFCRRQSSSNTKSGEDTEDTEDTDSKREEDSEQAIGGQADGKGVQSGDDEADGRRQLGSDSSDDSNGSDGSDGSDGECAAAAAYDCNDYFGVRRDLLRIIDDNPWQTPDWMRIALADHWNRDGGPGGSDNVIGDMGRFGKPPPATNAISLCEEGDCRGMDVYPMGSELLLASEVNRLSRFNGVGDMAIFSDGDMALRENVKVVGMDYEDFPLQNDIQPRGEMGEGRTYRGSLCFEGLFWSVNAPAFYSSALDNPFQLQSWKVAMAAKTGVLGCCADYHSTVYNRDFLGEVSDTYMYENRRRRGGGNTGRDRSGREAQNFRQVII